MKEPTLLEISSSSRRIKELFKMALLVREKAHCPYSGHKVGAVIRTSTDQLFTGCNVENSSYGASLCAERVAIHKAVSELGEISISEVLVVTDAPSPWPPCGECRQVMSEFGVGCTILAANVQGFYFQTTLEEILPHAFTPEYLKR